MIQGLFLSHGLLEALGSSKFSHWLAACQGHHRPAQGLQPATSRKMRLEPCHGSSRRGPAGAVAVPRSHKMANDALTVAFPPVYSIYTYINPLNLDCTYMGATPRGCSESFFDAGNVPACRSQCLSERLAAAEIPLTHGHPS